MSNLGLSTDLHDRCIAIARAALPNEACGFLVGKIPQSNKSAPLVSEIVAVANSLRSPTAFALDGAEMIAAEDEADRSGLSIVGVMHSHPTSQAVPSSRDIADADRYDPSCSYVHLLVSLQGFAPTIRAFRYNGIGATPDEFSLVVDKPLTF